MSDRNDYNVNDFNFNFACATSALSQGRPAERAAKIKHDKYQELTRSFEFCAVINEEGARFLTNLGHRRLAVSGNPRETAFLFQRLSIIVQRCNAVSFEGIIW